MSFLDFLADKGLIAQGEAKNAPNEADDSLVVENILAEKGFAPDEITRLKAEFLRIPVRNMGETHVPTEILKLIPEESVSFYKFVPLGVSEGVLEVGIVDPNNLEAMDALQFISAKLGMPFKVFLISREDYENISKDYSGLTGEVNKALSNISGDEAGDLGGSLAGEDVQNLDEPTIAPETGKTIVEDAPVTKMVSVILRHAIEGNASDIHIEHMGEKVRVRFRVDGELQMSLLLPAAVHSSVVSRIKILANLKLDERRKPQDGRFSTRIDQRKVDFRISTMPAYYGEKVVMRILDTGKGILSLTSLGMKDEDLAIVRNAIKRPYGMVLLTGPTGSGKSTTLYAMLNELDRDSNNIVSLEDPVEYSIPGVSQSQVRPEIGFTFANGLRSILRQDPDIIMVGEIRDKETAQLAVQAALTGHLVFSTLHTNTATGVVTRLMDMGVDPYLIAPTLILAIGQRLVSTMCAGAGKPMPITNAMKIMMEKSFHDLPKEFLDKIAISETVFEAMPTPECSTGIRGRLAAFEIFRVTPSVQEAILKHPIESEIYKIARSEGMLTMREDALIKAFAGTIPFVEVNKL
ncbi:GspE/PulE family protein [bacterium]|nr:GspE/PulE family protein [bacterium]